MKKIKTLAYGLAGKSGAILAAFVLGSLTMVMATMVVAAPTATPPGGQVNAGFNSVKVGNSATNPGAGDLVVADQFTSGSVVTGSIYVSNTLDFERIRSFSAGDLEFYLYSDNLNPRVTSDVMFVGLGAASRTSSESKSLVRLIESDLSLETNANIICGNRSNPYDPESCNVNIASPIKTSYGLDVKGTIKNTDTVSNSGRVVIDDELSVTGEISNRSTTNGVNNPVVIRDNLDVKGGKIFNSSGLFVIDDSVSITGKLYNGSYYTRSKGPSTNNWEVLSCRPEDVLIACNGTAQPSGTISNQITQHWGTIISNNNLNECNSLATQSRLTIVSGSIRVESGYTIENHQIMVKCFDPEGERTGNESL